MSAVGSQITLPFAVDASGGIAFTTDPAKLYRDRIVSVLGTYFGERVMRARYGSEVIEHVFDVLDENLLQGIISSQVSEALRVWEPEINVEAVNVTATTTGQDIGKLTIEVSYSIRNVSTLDETIIYTASISIAGTLTNLGA